MTIKRTLLLAHPAPCGRRVAPRRRPHPRRRAEAPAKSILEAELEPPPGGYTYNPQGRRDPFVSLVRR